MTAEGHGGSAGVWHDGLAHSNEEITPELRGASEVSCEAIAIAKEPGWRGQGSNSGQGGCVLWIVELRPQWSPRGCSTAGFVVLCTPAEHLPGRDLNLGQIS